MLKSLRRALVPMLALAAVSTSARAQLPDHLKCYKVKDPLARKTYVADIGGLAAEPGCLIKVPAKLVCVEATKTNVTPSPPGSPEGEIAGRFICYKTKCPRVPLPSVPVTDQFGTRTLRAIGGGMLCAPIAPPSSTTTTGPPCIPDGGTCTIGSGPLCCQAPCTNGICIHPPPTTTTTSLP